MLSNIRFRLRLNNQKRLIVGVVLVTVCMGLCLSQGAIIQGIIFSCCFVVLSLIDLDCAPRVASFLNIVWCSFSAIVAVVLTQLLLNVGISSITPKKLILGMVCVGFFISFVFLCTKNYRATGIVGVLIPLLLATVNHFVFWFRGSEFAPYDFLAAVTAFNVAGKYTFELTAPMVYAYVICALYCYCGFLIPKCKVNRKAKGMLVIFSVSVGLFVLISFGTSDIKAQHFGQMGSYNNGYLLNFSLQLRNMGVKKPTGYSGDALRAQENVYPAAQELNCERSADVIVIMSEAFGDLTVLGSELKTDDEIMPFVSSLYDNTIRGHALVSGIGGGTSNSEYEFLTSNSLGLLPTGCFPFQQYVEPGSYSIVVGLKNLGYKSLGTHPANGDNWMRTTVYPNLGFDEYHFVEDYPNERLLREMVSDQEMFDQLIQWYETKEQDESIFIFGVTMQNHSPYDFEELEFDLTVDLRGYSQEYPDAEQYLSLLNESDAAMERLITYFGTVDDDVVVLVFGDHMPQLSGAFYKELHGGTFDTLDEQMLQYMVPFFVWANFDIEERDVGLTSLNFLSNYVYEAAGLPLPAYNAFLKDIQSVVPAMNAFGYYSNDKGTFIPYEEAEGEEADALNLYRILQYNCLFDEENRSKVFFPTTEIETP